MISKIKIESKIRYSDAGKGNAIVFLHGYLESLKIWNSLVYDLRKDFRVIAIDLPGQGHSNISREIQTMESMAYEVQLILKNLKIDKCLMVGHSMGGYVGLAFLEKYPTMLAGLSLFHSSPYADNDEKKLNRDREIDLLKNGKKIQLYGNHMQNIFAVDNIDKFDKRIQKLKERALKTPTEFIISVIKGMKSRPDRSEILKNTTIPIQYIIGAKDNFIPISILDKLKLPDNSNIVILQNSGHMGMYEEPEKSITSIRHFIQNSITFA